MYGCLKYFYLCAKEKKELTETVLDGMDGGFVLTYGGIEENCTIKALFDAKREELSDKVNRQLDEKKIPQIAGYTKEFVIQIADDSYDSSLTA